MTIDEYNRRYLHDNFAGLGKTIRIGPNQYKKACSRDQRGGKRVGAGRKSQPPSSLRRRYDL